MAITYKTAEEIDIMREGGRRLAEVLRGVADAVKPGVTTAELNDLANRLITGQGDSPAFLHYRPRGAARGYPASICVSVNSAIVHGIPNEKPYTLKEGDIVALDAGVVHRGLITDSAITVGVGKIGKDAERLLTATKEALYRGIEAARPGSRVGDIGAAIEEYVRTTGFSLAENLSGHGVGYSVHEDPFVPNIGRRGEGPELKEGMVIAIEPMLNAGKGKIKLEPDGFTLSAADGALSAHFEHTVAITKDGPVILTALASMR